MSEKYQKIFIRILVITAAVWALGVAGLDIAFPLLRYRFRDPDKPFIGGHGGGWMLCGTPLCILVVVVSFIVLYIKSRKDDPKT